MRFYWSNLTARRHVFYVSKKKAHQKMGFLVSVD
jgi:hypothetical protein